MNQLDKSLKNSGYVNTETLQSMNSQLLVSRDTKSGYPNKV